MNTIKKICKLQSNPVPPNKKTDTVFSPSEPQEYDQRISHGEISLCPKTGERDEKNKQTSKTETSNRDGIRGIPSTIPLDLPYGGGGDISPDKHLFSLTGEETDEEYDIRKNEILVEQARPKSHIPTREIRKLPGDQIFLNKKEKRSMKNSRETEKWYPSLKTQKHIDLENECYSSECGDSLEKFQVKIEQGQSKNEHQKRYMNTQYKKSDNKGDFFPPEGAPRFIPRSSTPRENIQGGNEDFESRMQRDPERNLCDKEQTKRNLKIISDVSLERYLAFPTGTNKNEEIETIKQNRKNVPSKTDHTDTAITQEEADPQGPAENKNVNVKSLNIAPGKAPKNANQKKDLDGINRFKDRFLGTPSQDIESFLAKFDHFCEVHGHDDGYKCKNFQLHLDGKAFTSYKNFSTETKSDYLKLKEEMMAHYGEVKLPIEKGMQMIANLPMKKSESVQDFHDRVLKVTENLQMNPENKQIIF